MSTCVPVWARAGCPISLDCSLLIPLRLGNGKLPKVCQNGNLLTISASLASQQALGSTCLCPPNQHWDYSSLHKCRAPSLIFINVLFGEKNEIHPHICLPLQFLCLRKALANLSKVHQRCFSSCIHKVSIFIAKTFIIFNFEKWVNRLSMSFHKLLKQIMFIFVLIQYISIYKDKYL